MKLKRILIALILILTVGFGFSIANAKSCTGNACNPLPTQSNGCNSNSGSHNKHCGNQNTPHPTHVITTPKPTKIVKTPVPTSIKPTHIIPTSTKTFVPTAVKTSTPSFNSTVIPTSTPTTALKLTNVSCGTNNSNPWLPWIFLALGSVGTGFAMKNKSNVKKLKG